MRNEWLQFIVICGIRMKLSNVMSENLLFIGMNQTTFGCWWPKTHWWYYTHCCLIFECRIVVFSPSFQFNARIQLLMNEKSKEKSSESKITLSHGEAHESIVHYGCDVMSLPFDFYNLIIGAAKHRHSVDRISCCQFESKTPSPKPVTPSCRLLKKKNKYTATTTSMPSL